MPLANQQTTHAIYPELLPLRWGYAARMPDQCRDVPATARLP